MLLSKFLPKEFDFFNLFEQQVGFALEAAKKFKEIAATEGLLTEASYREIEDIEHRADKVTHSIIAQLNKTFITPFDREDIYALTKELDNIVDMIDSIVNRLKVYRISGGNKNLIQFAGIIEQSVIAVAATMKGLRAMKNSDSVMEAFVEVNRLENIGDDMRDGVLAELFETVKDPIEVIKWKDIYIDAEEVTDICEDVAHLVESILVKQS
ncbi:MAG: DUF47 domain-containing protein [Verrucomicrobiota bacterium]